MTNEGGNLFASTTRQLTLQPSSVDGEEDEPVCHQAARLRQAAQEVMERSIMEYAEVVDDVGGRVAGVQKRQIRVYN